MEAPVPKRPRQGSRRASPRRIWASSGRGKLGRGSTQEPERGPGRIRRPRGKRHILIHTFNANLYWRWLQEYLENDVVKQLQQGATPIVACQEHGA